MPCVLNAANEVVNAAFRNDEIPYPAIADIIARTMRSVAFDATSSLDTYLDTDAEARAVAQEMVKTYNKLK